jgi:hypothetical protein
MGLLHCEEGTAHSLPYTQNITGTWKYALKIGRLRYIRSESCQFYRNCSLEITCFNVVCEEMGSAHEQQLFSF